MAMLKAPTGQDLTRHVVQNMEVPHGSSFWNMSQGFQIETEMKIFAIISVRRHISNSSKKHRKQKAPDFLALFFEAQTPGA